MLGANIQNLLSARKDISITPSTKMKQLQWDKLPMQQAERTVFKEPTREDEWVKKLQLDGVWNEMEEDFKAKQLVINLMGAFMCTFVHGDLLLMQRISETEACGAEECARPADQEASRWVPQASNIHSDAVIDTPSTEILIQTVKRLQPEELALRIRDFDQGVCTQVFLSELKPVLPNPEQVGYYFSFQHHISDGSSSGISQIGKLNVYRNADPEELGGLHPADRLMVQLIKIDRLGPRIEGMLYKCVFDETWGLLDDVSPSLPRARQSEDDAHEYVCRALVSCQKPENRCWKRSTLKSYSP